MSLLLREKLAISSIFPLQKGGSRTPSNSKYLLSNSIGVLGVSASLSAILDTSRQFKKDKTSTPAPTVCLSVCSFVLITDEVDDGDDAVSSFPSVGDAQGEGRVDLEPIKGERGDVMRMHECQHQDHCVGPEDARVTKRRLPPVTHHYQP